LHKLFDGPECIAGLNLRLDLSLQLINDKLKRFHQFMKTNGYISGWGGKDLENDPFVIRDEQIATLSRGSEFGTGVLQPKAQPLVVEATYQGKRLSFTVDGRYTSDPANLEWSPHDHGCTACASCRSGRGEARARPGVGRARLGVPSC
jgi:hypothetical protein